MSTNPLILPGHDSSGSAHEVVEVLCSIDGCSGEVTARGWCRKHYMRWNRTGHPEGLKGRSPSEETRRKMSDARVGVPRPAEVREKISATRRARAVVSRTVNKDGYYQLAGAHWDHPVATNAGTVLEHRVVLYDTIGPGPHECHWSVERGCGRTDLYWGGGSEGLVVDHLNGDKLDNRPENLVPSCRGCNWNRGRWA